MKQRHDDPQFKLRIPASLKVQLEAKARQNNRSLSAEILQRLEDSLSHGEVLEDSNPPSEFSRITEQLNILTSAIHHEETILRMMIDSPHLVKTDVTRGAIEMQKIRIEAHKNQYLNLIKKAGLKVNPDNIFELVWD